MPSPVLKDQTSTTERNLAMVVEKPFGYDLNLLIIYSMWLTYLRETVYRIDHYLGKDTVNNIVATRFGNILLEPLWNSSTQKRFRSSPLDCEL